MKTKPISIDASIIIRLFIDDIPAQSDLAVSCIETHKSISVSDIAIIETVYALRLYVKHPKLSIEDCYMSAWASVNTTDCLYTFDKN